MGFYKVLELKKKMYSCFNLNDLIPLPKQKEKISCEEILAAHKALAGLNKKNMDMFKDLIEQLEK